jgi:pimeloyl-ACP methyl ester carboxylesterase
LASGLGLLILICAAPAQAHPRGGHLLAGAPAAEAPSPSPTIVIGSQTLSRCSAAPLGYCGHLSVPLDHSDPSGPHISIAYRFYPATAPVGGVASGTVVPVEGGPGYPSIESVKEGYAGMYGPLLEHWNMLAVDNRGTGASAGIDCPALQNFSGPTATEAFQLAAAKCAAALNSRWHYPGGAPVHASDLFTSAPAAQDMAEVIEALDLGKVDLYGDSYGSFYAQVFASRFPNLVRSVILDSTYETVDLDPWYRSTVEAMPGDFDAACERWAPCAQAAPGTAWERIGAVAQALRTQPISGTVPGSTGAREEVSMNVVGLVDLMNDAAGDPQIYRDLDAADRALLYAGDPAPLLRLYAQRLALDEAYFHLPVSEYSVGLYLAVSCLDYPQLFNMQQSPAVRAEELSAAEEALPAATFSPFTTQEWLAQDQNTEAYSACLDWPAPTIAQPPVEGSLPLLAPRLPVLVLGGELDTWTPPAAHAKVLAQIGGHSRFIEVANSTHVVGETDTVCGSTLVQEFVEHPSQIDSMNASCAVSAPAIHAVGTYPASLEEEPPITPMLGVSASSGDLRLAAAAVETAGDAIARKEAIDVSVDHGLSGGTVINGPSGNLLRLQGDELIPGVAVSGTLKLTPADQEVEGSVVSAKLTVTARGFETGTFTASWTTDAAGPASITGSVGGETLAGTTPAP